MRYWSNYFDRYFYQYLFEKPNEPGWCSNNPIIDWWKRLKCRFNDHPCGSIYYNPGGFEPDDRCKNCGDYL